MGAHATGAGPIGPHRWTSNFTPGPGGVMTDEVGVITGELTLATEVDCAGKAVLRVQYYEANEWYTVTHGRYHLDDPGRGRELHDAALALLSRGGADAAELHP